ncbi:MAG: 30S ribosomal protein S20 [Kiritimatiellae bacterium]|nr:30S ribosomal protein S20 [Kiritimatiellia bacterium]
MPNIKSAKKRMLTSEKSRQGNVAVKSLIMTERKKLYDAIITGDAEVIQTTLNKYNSSLDKAVKRGALKANAANRRKSRAVARIRKATA